MGAGSISFNDFYRTPEFFHLPITSNSAAAINVWNEGASADTSQLYLPDVAIVTASSTTWLSFEDIRYKIQKNEGVLRICECTQ